jgi:FkbM family methyltransferase
MYSPTVSGIKYYIENKSDVIQQTLFNGNQWNKEIIDIITSYISERQLNHFLNVGAHIGSVCLPISLSIKKVTAIEAYPDTFQHLCKNIEINNQTNITTINIAVGNSEEDIYFMSMDKICPIENINRVINNTGGMHVFTEHDIQNNVRSSNLTDKKIKHQINKLDNLNIDDFDIMLVDIEGFEYDFLLGAEQVLKKNKPIIIIEIWNDEKRKNENMVQTQSQVVNHILSMGYILVQEINDDFIFEPIESNI